MKKRVLCLAIAAVAAIPAFAQSQSAKQAPVIHINVSRTIQMVGYRNREATQIDFQGTALLPRSEGKGKVESKDGRATIQADLKGLPPASSFGSPYLTYVLWAISAEGRPNNLGEILLKGSGGKLSTSVRLQTFGMIVTAEPYFAVSRPSELIVLENQPNKSTKGKLFEVKDYPLLERGEYEKLGNPLALSLDLKHVPLEMYQARNSVEIAKSRGAEKYAPEIFSKAENSLKMSENLLARKAGKKQIISQARQTVQFSEDARALAVKRQEAELVEQSRQAAAAKATAEAEAKAAAQAAEAKRKADEEAQRQAELAAAREAQLKAESEAIAAKEAAARAQAQALAEKEAAARADAERARQVAQALRAQLLDQLNAVLQTRDTPRGLVVTMADVLFATGKYNLRTEARERLARLSGIVASHPGLVLQVEGHTDSVGSDEFNQKLSEQRAEAVRAYLIEQGLAEGTITAVGLGKTMPIADNTTAEGRQKNRRVEIIVSGEVIGAKIGTSAAHMKPDGQSQP